MKLSSLSPDNSYKVISGEDEEADISCQPTRRSTSIEVGDDDVEALEPGEIKSGNGIPTSISYRLFISHFLSTWNSRLFEFGAVLFIAAIFPGTLLWASLYALARGLAAICLAPVVGRYVDQCDRLRVVRVSIGRYFNYTCVISFWSS